MSYRLTFDAPLRPDVTNVGDATILLVDLDDRSGTHPAGLLLGAHVRILRNTLDESIVEVEPSGIMPFGHTLALEYPAALRGLSQDGDPGAGSAVASAFRVALAPDETLVDVLRESFESDARRDPSPGEAAEGFPPADWDRSDSDVLQAAFSFEGSGLLGRFLPPAPPAGETLTVVLDTDLQGFPLPDGSTPDAPVTSVSGGRFHFTEIDVPDGAAPRPSASAENTELGRKIEEALAGLGEDQRMAFVLREYEGLEYTAIAQVLGVSEGTVKSRLHRAKETLRHRLAPYLRTGT